MSRMTSEGRRSESAASALSLSAAVRVPKPSSSNIPETRSRISASSSIIRISSAMTHSCYILTLVLCSLVARLGEQRQCGEIELQQGDRPSLRAVAQFERALMIFGNLLHDRQPQPGALGPGGHIRLGKPVLQFRRKAHAVVRDGNAEQMPLKRNRNFDGGGIPLPIDSLRIALPLPIPGFL